MCVYIYIYIFVFIYIFLKPLFFRVKFTVKLRGRYRQFPYIHSPQTGITSPINDILQQSGTFVTSNEPKWCIIITQSPWVTHSSLAVIHSMGLDKCIMTSRHHYSIVKRNFTILKKSPVIHLFISPLSTPTWCCLLSPYFLPPESHLVEIIQSVIFSN